MTKILTTLLLFISFQIYANDNTKSAAWGKIVHAEKSVKNISYQYFVYFVQDGKSHAYPIETSNKKIANLIKQNTDKNVHITGQVKEITVKMDGPEQKLLVFIPEDIKPLTLSELALQGPVDINGKSKDPSLKQNAYDGGGIRIKDEYANALIYSAAAIMLGSELSRIFKKD